MHREGPTMQISIGGIGELGEIVTPNMETPVLGERYIAILE